MIKIKALKHMVSGTPKSEAFWGEGAGTRTVKPFFSSQKKKAANQKGSPRRGADGGGRTHTVLLPRDFESRASANSTTSAYQNITQL